ncbi:MAG: MFS transporter [Burkholderiaceae bacterium]
MSTVSHGRYHLPRLLLHQRPFLALWATLVVQTLTAMTLALPPVLAPAVAPLLGYEVEHVGFLVGAAYIPAMFSGLLGSSYVPRYGALRLSQLAMVLCAVSLALMTVGSMAAFLMAAALLGVGYGLTNPTSAKILGEHTPANRRGLIFSLKQTGVPLGIALAGSAGAWLFATFDWQVTLWIAAALCVLVALSLQPTVTTFDRQLEPGRVLNAKALFAPLAEVLSISLLRRLAFVSLIYAFVQVSVVTFLVAHLHLTFGLPLTLAAGALAAAQVTSVIARPFWGWCADKSGRPALLLGLLGLGSALTCLALALLPAQAPLAAILAASLCCAATAIGWNGVFYAELITQAGPGKLATVTGAVQFLTFMGAMLGPIVVATVVSQTNSYAAGMFGLSILVGCTAAWLLLSQRPRATMSDGSEHNQPNL